MGNKANNSLLDKNTERATFTKENGWRQRHVVVRTVIIKTKGKTFSFLQMNNMADCCSSRDKNKTNPKTLLESL